MFKIPNLFETDGPPLNICSQVYFATINLLFHVPFQNRQSLSNHYSIFPQISGHLHFYYCHCHIENIHLFTFKFYLFWASLKSSDYYLLLRPEPEPVALRVFVSQAKLVTRVKKGKSIRHSAHQISPKLAFF